MSYDSWLEGAYDRPATGNSPYAPGPPGNSEDYLDARVFVVESDDFGTIENAEEWTDEDEGGKYGGVSVEIKLDTPYKNGKHPTVTMEEYDLEDTNLIVFVDNSYLEDIPEDATAKREAEYDDWHEC